MIVVVVIVVVVNVVCGKLDSLDKKFFPKHNFHFLCLGKMQKEKRKEKGKRKEPKHQIQQLGPNDYIFVCDNK